MAQSATDGIKTSKVSPAFLHGNSTSHTWPFSAVAELIDNAYDPDVNASELWIDHRIINGINCLTFVDNGNGLTEDRLHKMLSFGYCDKVTVGGIKPIGHYGNGFKSGSMRLGADALVFTRSAKSTSVGFLSQTYLRAINADSVFVPIVTWDLHTLTRRQTLASNRNLDAILSHSLFNKEKDLFGELKSLEKMRTGSNIIIYNLKQEKSGKFELDFVSDKLDVKNPETHVIDLTTINRPIHTALPEYRRSLREYCSILYLKPRMKIVLRGQKVVTKLVSKSLRQTEIDTYRPTWVPRPIKITFGFTDNKEPESYGLLMYHKNRLIKAYEKIGCQKQANQHGVGVVGVVEANFLEPIHNKQDFNRTDKYSAFMQNAAMKMNDYFFEKTQSENPDRQHLNVSRLPDWTWAQCDNCLSWRRLPTGYNEKLPEKWFCWLNPDAAFNRCEVPEEPEDDDEALQPTYRKTYKKKEEEKKRLAKIAEERKIAEKEAALQKKEKILKRKMKEMERQNETLAEVTSSQDKVDRKPTVRDLEVAQVNLEKSQQKLAEQEKLIKQLAEREKENEANRQAMLRLAKNIELKSVEEQQLVNKVKDMTGTRNTTVSSSSNTLRAPIKRKADVANAEEPDGKVVKIKKEGGGFMTVTTSGMIDLTEDDNDMDTSPPPVDHSGHDISIDKPEETPEKSKDKTTNSEKPEKTTTADKVAVEKDKKSEKKAIENDAIKDMEKDSKTETESPAIKDSTDESSASKKESKNSSSSTPVKKRTDTKIEADSKVDIDKKETTKIEPIADTRNEEPISSTKAEEATADTSKEEPTAGTSKEEPTGGTSKEEPTVGTSKEEPTADTSKEEPTAGTSKEEPTVGTSKEEPTAGTSKEEPIAGTSKEEPIAGTSKEEPTAGTSKEEPTAGTSKEEPTAGTSKINEKGDASVTAKKDGASYTEMDEDVKPIKEELDKQIHALKTVLAHKGSQTVPTVVKFVSPEEMDLLSLSPLDQKQMLLQKARELEENKRSLKSLQDNVWQLLKIIVPDFDYGNPDNIENIILDFIRVNGEAS